MLSTNKPLLNERRRYIAGFDPIEDWDAELYLCVAALSTLLFFGLPLCLFPLRWAGWMHWKIPAHTHLTVYFGRCLGVLVCVMSGFALVAATSDRIVCSFYYQFLLVNIAAMIALHLYGALTKI